jgi:ankyrin repeat protein
LIELGAEINAPPSSASFGRTALQAAVEVGDVEFVQFLLKEGAEVNAPAAPYCGVTALQAAAMTGYLRIAQILLEHGADIDADPSPRHGRTAIGGAAELGRIDMVKLLLDNYNGPRSISDVCASAMKYAKGENQWYVMEFLKKYEPPTR